MQNYTSEGVYWDSNEKESFYFIQKGYEGKKLSNENDQYQ